MDDLELVTLLFLRYDEGKGVQKRLYIQKGGEDMNLELSAKEQEMLLGVLNDYIPELRGEIASGGKHDFKEELKEEEAVLNVIREKLIALK
jgi:hypothetical protein